MSEQLITCPHCGAKNAAKDLTTGDKVVCPGCGRELEVACYVEAKQSPEERKFTDGFLATGKWGLLIGGILGAIVGAAMGFTGGGVSGAIRDLVLWGIILGVVVGVGFGIVGGLGCRKYCKL